MVELGRQSPSRPTSLKAIADAEGLPLAYLEQVVARLRRANLVLSSRGAHGGYWLARDPSEITMHDVVAALDGAIAPMECFLHDEMERIVCSHLPQAGNGPCATKLLWTRVQGGIIRALETTTLADLVEFSLRVDGPSPRAAVASSPGLTGTDSPLEIEVELERAAPPLISAARTSSGAVPRPRADAVPRSRADAARRSRGSGPGASPGASVAHA